MRTNIKCFLISIILFCITAINSFAEPIGELTAEQINSVNMLNYLTVLMTDINNSKDNELYINEVYSSILNKINPNSVDVNTQMQFTSFLNILENFKNANIRRNRLNFIYERNRNSVLKSAIPNPIGLLSAVGSGSPLKTIASIAYMTADSASNYMSAKNEIELQFIQDNWEVDDEFNKQLHNMRKEMFNYLIEITNDYNIPKEYSLTENKVNDYIQCKNDSNLKRKIKWFEDNEKEYRGYANYYLDLAFFYNEDGQYQKCIDAISSYENMNVGIFRKDYNYANILMYGISALFELIDNNERQLDILNSQYYEKRYLDGKVLEFKNKIIDYLTKILNNIEYDNWALRYFVICSYIDLSKRDANYSVYLSNAYDEVVKNINVLDKKQEDLNKEYSRSFEDGDEEIIPKDATKEQKKQIKKSNEQMKEMKKKDLAPILYALTYNLDLYYELRDKFPETPTNIDYIFNSNDMLFYYIPYNNKYLKVNDKVVFDVDLTNSREVCIPLLYVQEGSSITAKLKNNNNGEITLIDDFDIDFVERNSNDPRTFKVYYKSEKMNKIKIKESDDVEICIYVIQDSGKKDSDSPEGEQLKYQYIPKFKRTWYTCFIGKKVMGFEKV